MVGAFDTGGAPLLLRLIYWIPLVIFGTGLGFVVALRTMRRPRIGEISTLVWAIVTAAVSAPSTAIVWMYTNLVFGRPPQSLLWLLLDVTIVAGAAAAIMMLINRPGPVTRILAEGPDGSRPPVRFLGRLPTKLKEGRIFAVQAEDHYLRVYTSKGSDLILMRLSDAIAELDGIEGAQVHRSWWVARDGFSGVERADRKLTLVLKDGSKAPVSRPNAAALRESGWFN